MASSIPTHLDIAYDRYSMILNGRRTVIRSGAMHYFRLPSQALWRDRLFKLKAAGYNTVDLYFCWDYHSPAPGVYDFDGIRDVGKLLEITQDLGLYVIARPGPYINAEYTAGGLPKWLLTQPGVVLRNRQKDGAFTWSEPYMQAVREWWGQIIPRIRPFANLLMLQIENEYATLDVESDYMKALADWTRELGVTIPLMHNDLYAAGLYSDDVDLYAFDNYSVTSFETDWRHHPEVFGVLDGVEQNLRPFCEERPLMVAELQAGWFGGWKGVPYEDITRSLGREHIAITTKSLLGQGLTIFNHYKAIGGTNWGYIGSTDTYTSYDFGAPISEAGLNTERLYEAKTLNTFLESFDLAATERVASPSAALSDDSLLYAVRQPVERPGESWLFLRNLTPHGKDLTLDRRFDLHVKPYEVLILPYHVTLKNGYKLMRSSVEPVYQSEHFIVFKGDRPVEIQFQIEANEGSVPVEVKAGEAKVFRQLDAIYAVACDAVPPNGYVKVRLGDFHVYILGSHRVDTLWVQEDGFVMSGPEARLDGTHYGMANPRAEVLVIAPRGTLTREKGFEVVTPPRLPDLKHWKSYHEAPELYQADGFSPISPNGADFDVNGLYEGSGWYRYSIPMAVTANTLGSHHLTLSARHIWAVFMNGKLVAHGHHLDAAGSQEPPPPQRMVIPPRLLNNFKENDLVIFVDGLGHPKGFHDDADVPQGLISLHLDDEDITGKLRFSPRISDWQSPLKNLLGLFPEQSPLVRLKTRFVLHPLEAVEMPLGLSLRNMDYERVNIYLNGTLIGRHWRECQRQSTYYLPPGILKTQEGEENILELILMNFDPFISLAECLPNENQVFLKPYGVLTKVQL